MAKENSMFKDIEDLQKFILWAKSEKISQLQVGDIQVIFSPLAMVEDNEPDLSRYTATVTPKTEERNTGRAMVDDMTADAETDDDLLFHSAR